MPRRSGRKGHKYGENRTAYLPTCLWCGTSFPSKRPDSQTDTPACRSALSRFVRKHGGPPLFPFGVKPDNPPKPASKPAKKRKRG